MSPNLHHSPVIMFLLPCSLLFAVVVVIAVVVVHPDDVIVLLLWHFRCCCYWLFRLLAKFNNLISPIGDLVAAHVWGHKGPEVQRRWPGDVAQRPKARPSCRSSTRGRQWPNARPPDPSRVQESTFSSPTVAAQWRQLWPRDLATTTTTQGRWQTETTAGPRVTTKDYPETTEVRTANQEKAEGEAENTRGAG